MTDEIGNLILKRLNQVYARLDNLENHLDELTNDVGDIGIRLLNLEQSVALNRTHVDARLTRIEKHLEII